MPPLPISQAATAGSGEKCPSLPRCLQCSRIPNPPELCGLRDQVQLNPDISESIRPSCPRSPRQVKPSSGTCTPQTVPPKSSTRPQVFHARSRPAAQNQGPHGLDTSPTPAPVQAREQRDAGLSCRGRPARHQPARMPSPRRCRDRRGCMEPQRAAGVLTIARGLRTARLWMQLRLRLGLRLRCAVL